ncbi:hypothetical protein PInf_010197 [Phytophthora infestans]|nr:hypothetical protein PInf_010197 [Phytophthora infestans]
MVVLELFYVFVSIPLRIGFLFDPYATDDWSSGWTDELTLNVELKLPSLQTPLDRLELGDSALLKAPITHVDVELLSSLVYEIPCKWHGL